MTDLTAAPAREAITAAPRPTIRARLAAVWTARGGWLGLGAWALAWWAQTWLEAEPGRTLAMGALVLAGLVAILAWGAGRLRRGLVARAVGAPLIVLTPAVGLRLAGIALAAGATWAASTAFLAAPGDAFGLAGWLWLVGMAGLIANTWGWPQRQSAEPHADPVSNPRPALPAALRWELAAVAGLLALALVLRLWNLQGWPFQVHGDEILTGRNAMQSFLNITTVSPFRTVWESIDLPGLWFWLIARVLDLGGGTLAALRLPAALFGAATILPFYGLVRGAWGRAAALAGGAIFAVSAVEVHYSRVTLNNITTPFFWTVCFYFLLRGVRRGRPLDWVLAGIAAGLSEYGYYGTHLLPFLLLAFGGYLLVVHWRQGWRMVGHFALLALGYLAGFGPLLAYFRIYRPDIYFGRGAAEGVMMWNHIPRDGADLQLMWNTLWPLMAENLLGFSVHGSQDTVYWAPLLFIGEAALLVLGVALMIWHWRHPAAFLLLMSGGAVLFVGGTLVHGNPFIAHWTPAFPAFYAAIAVPLGAWAAGWRLAPARLRPLLPGLLVGGLALASVVNIDFYFNHYRIPRPEFEVRAAQNRWTAALGTTYQVYSAGPTWQPYDPEGLSYMIKGQIGGVLQNAASELPIRVLPGHGLAFIFFPDNEQFRPLIEARYPGGTPGEIVAHDNDHTHLFYTYVLTPQQLGTLGAAPAP